MTNKPVSRIIVTANTTTSEPIITKTFLDKGLHTDLESVTYSLSSSHVSANEGDTVTITLTANGLPNNSDIAYVVTGISSSDLSSGSLTGDFEISNGTGAVSFTLANDLTTEGSETLSLSLVNGKASKNVTIGDTSLTPTTPPTYSLTSDNSSYNEGDTINITLTTTNVGDGTLVPYTVSGITGTDLSSGSLTGNFEISNGTGSVSFTLANDLITEGSETFTIDLNNGQASITVDINDTSMAPTYSLSSDNSSYNEGDTINITLTTTNVGDGTLVPYTITGIDSSDITASTLTGNFVVSNGSASLSFVLTNDLTTEGTETFTIALNNGEASKNVTIGDTSLTPATYSLSSDNSSYNEGDTINITLTTTNVDDGTNIPYTISGITGADLSSGAISGNFNVSSGAASLSFVLTNDVTTEGEETFTIALNNGEASKSVTINDTSLTKTYSLTSDNSSYNEGDTINITLTTTNVDDGTNIPYTVSGITGADLSSGAISGNFVVTSGAASLSFVLTNDVTTEGTETFTIALNNGEASKSVTINDTSLTPPTYSISRNAANINEDGSVVFTLTTENVGDGTLVPFTITGINSSDITASTLTGNFVVSNGSATKSFIMVQDATTEGSEIMTLTLDNGLAANSVIINDTSLTPATPATYSLTSSSESINEGQSVLFTLTTTNVTDGTTIPYTVTGIDVADLVSGSLTGVFTINSNQGTQSYGLVNDTTTEGEETLTLSLDNGAASKSVTINDTSVGVPSYSLARSASNVNEGGAVSFTLTTNNVADGTNIAYTVTGISSDDLTSGSLTGNFVMSSGTATQSFVLAEDVSTEGAETMTMALDNGQGGISSVTVNDTSEAVSYSLGRNAAAIDEGLQVVISLSTTGVSTGTNVAYTVSGIDANDIRSDSAPLTGNFTTSGSGTNSKTFKLKEDVTTEGTETLTLALDNGEAAITVDINDTSIAPTYDLTPSSSTANEGDTITFTLNTEGVGDAAMIAYTVTGINSGDLSSGDMTGNFIISSGTATKSFTLATDESTEGPETMTVTIDATGDSASVTINDTSTTPTPSPSVKLYLPFDGSYSDGSTFNYAHRFVEQGHGAITAGGVSISQIMNSGSKYGSGHLKTQVGDRGIYQSSYNDWWTGSSSSDIRLLTYAYTDQSTMPWYPTTNSAYNGRAKSFTIQFWIKFLEVDTSPSHVTTSSALAHRAFAMGDAGSTMLAYGTWRPWLVCQLQGPASWDSSSEIPYLQIFQYVSNTGTYTSYTSTGLGHLISYSNTNLSRTDWNHVAIQRIAPNPADHASVTSHQQACTYAVWHNGTRVSTDVAPVASQEQRRIGNSSNLYGGVPHPNRDWGWGHSDTVTPTITGTYSAFSQQPKHIVKFSGSNAKGFNLIDDFRYTVGESIYDTSQSSITVPSSALGNTI